VDFRFEQLAAGRGQRVKMAGKSKQATVLMLSGDIRGFSWLTQAKSVEKLETGEELLGWEKLGGVGFLWLIAAAVGRAAARRTPLRCRSASPDGRIWLAVEAHFCELERHEHGH